MVKVLQLQCRTKKPLSDGAICCWCSSHYNPGIIHSCFRQRETSLAHGYNNWNIHNYCSSRICCQAKQHSCCFVSQYLSAVSFAGQTVFFSWANIVCINDLQERAIVLASMNMFSNAVNAWWSILFYGADTAPEFKKVVGHCLQPQSPVLVLL